MLSQIDSQKEANVLTLEPAVIPIPMFLLIAYDYVQYLQNAVE